MRKFPRFFILLVLLAPCLNGQEKRLWVLRASGEMAEYDFAGFSVKQAVKVPPEALKNPANLEVSRSGQMLFAPALSLPLSEEDKAAEHKVWLWNGHTADTIDRGVEYKLEKHGSNQSLTESVPVPHLSEDGGHLFWFTNRMRRMQREEIDLSIETTWQVWQTDLAGAGRIELASQKLPECRCATGTCEESCPAGDVWAPGTGVENFFLLTLIVAGQTSPTYNSSIRYAENAGKWISEQWPKPLERVLDAASRGKVIVEAIPDEGCCGWTNQSNDQTLAFVNGKMLTVFDEQAVYKNPDYDVSFFTSNAELSPELGSVAMTIAATEQANKPIQLAEQGQANPEESQRIRKALADLPAVSVKTLEDSPRQTVFVPRATLIGWISDKELLIVEDHMLVVYSLKSGARRKSGVRVDDPARVFLR